MAIHTLVSVAVHGWHICKYAKLLATRPVMPLLQHVFEYKLVDMSEPSQAGET